MIEVTQSDPIKNTLTDLLTQLQEKEIKLWLEDGKVQVSAPKGAVTAELREQMMQHREELRTFLGQASIEQTIQPAERNGTAPLSHAQQQLWILMNLDNESAAYNVPTALRLRGNLDIHALEESLQHVFSRHEILRTTFPLADGHFVQHIDPAPSSYSVPITDLTHLSPDEREAQFRQAIDAAAGIPFDLENGPLTVTHLFRLTDSEHVLFLNQHHIVIDGWSTGILIHELSTAYRAISAREPIGLEPLPIQYADYAIWQNDWLQGAAYQQRLAYWADLLEGAPSLLELPTDHPRPPVQSTSGSSVSSPVSLELGRLIQHYSQEQDVTAQMTLMAAYLLLLARYSGTTDLVVGVPVANRPLPELEPLIGFFVNTLPIRFRLNLEDSFAALTQQIKKTMLAAYARQDVPFEQIVEKVKPERSLSYAPIFQVVFNFTSLSADDLILPDLTMEPVAAELNVAKHDLTLDANLIGDEIEVEWQFSTDLFEPETAERIGRHFLQILQHGLANPEQPIGTLPLLTAQERTQMLTEWNAVGNAGEAAFPLHLPVHELISRHAQTTPDEPALIFTDRDGVDHQMTFAEYDAAANQLAHYLQRQGVTVGTPVGICAERSLDVMVGILAIMKSGGVYVPLDPDYPEERLRQTIGDSQMALLLTQSHLLPKFDWSDISLFALDDDILLLAGLPKTKPSTTSTSDDGIYIIFTSGSTGKPKGVLAHHQGVANLALGLGQEISVKTGDRLLQFAPFSFDASALQMFVPLVNGGTLVLHHDPTKLSAQELMDYASHQRMTILDLPAALWRQWVADMSNLTLKLPATVRFFLTGGEAVPAETLRQWAHLSPLEVQFLSSYGPTEASITTTIFRSSNNELADVQEVDLTIGRPLPNTSVYLLDELMNPVPIGVHGEIYIGGVGVTKGYLNDAEMTAGKFIDNPFAPGQLYRTGDWGRFRANGDIEFLGRMDNQVKIRGFRIELGEIEAVLSTHPAVQDGIVTAPVDENGRKQLVAYVVPSVLVDDQIDRVEMRNFVAAHLPNHMVPAAFMQMDSLPLLPNGKVDRKGLPAPTAESLTRSAEYIAPTSQVEENLADIWRTLLGVESVGMNDNFFELGGDSIIGIQFIGRARDAGIHLTARDLFEYQTIAELAQVASAESTALTEQGLVVGSVPLTPIQQWFFNLNPVEPHHFNQSTMLTVPAEVTAQQVELVVGQLLAHHDALRAVFTLADDGWAQEFTDVPEIIPVEELELLSDLNIAAQQDVIESTADSIQRSLDLSQGPLFKAVLMRLGGEQPSRLLLIAHHLVVDGVSWRILLEDLQTLFMQVQGGAAALQLPSKSTSYRQWAEWLSNDAVDIVADQRAYWHNVVEQKVAPLPRQELATTAQSKFIAIESTLDADTTAQLLTEAHAPYQTQVNDLLLSALALAITEWSGDNQLLLALEGHGRTDLSDTIDLSRTVGWFTNQYPLYLNLEQSLGAGEASGLSNSTDLGRLIRSIKEQLRTVPNSGIGYNILRYMDGDSVLNAHLSPEVLFNYLGQTEAGMSVEAESEWGAATESMGDQISPKMGLIYPLEINGSVIDGLLEFSWSFDPTFFSEFQIVQVAERFNQVLRDIVDHCINAEARYTPSDFPLATITQDELDNLVERYPNAEAIYDATRAQAGMLFHSQLAPNSGVYILQSQLTLAADLDPDRLRNAFNCLIKRHTLLRTAFVGLDRQSPLQVVLPGPLDECDALRDDIDSAIPRAKLNWRELDWRNMDDFDSRYEALIEQDRLTDFGPDEAPLMRVTLIYATDGNYRLLWTTHHVITDGWSTAILFSELVHFYQAGSDSLTVLELPPAIPFENYVAWQQKQQPNAAVDFWRDTLAGFTEPTPLFDGAALDSHQAIRNASHTVQLMGESFRQLDAAARRERVTMSTLVQGAWSLLLSRYSQQDDVVVGITVSGRPADLPGAEEMMGMFLNILPLRIGLDQEEELWSWLRSIQERYVEADRFSYMPLHDIQQLSEISGGRNLFESLIVFQNYPTGDDAVEAVDANGALLLGFDAHEQTNFPITLFVSTSTESAPDETDNDAPEPGGLLHINIQYDANRFDANKITQIAEQLTFVLSEIADMADAASADYGPARLEQVELLSEAEWQQLLVEWNQTTMDYPRHETLVSLFEQRVQEMPSAVALINGDDQVTYGMLNHLANQIAYELVRLGVTRETLVGVCVERSPAMVAALLGILKTGGAYVPLDPSYPTERLNYMLTDSGAAVLVTDSSQPTEQPEDWFAENCQKGLQVLDLALLGGLDTDKADEQPFELEHDIQPDDLAYVIYTSGSTGQPKGVEAMHRGVMNRLYWMWKEMPFGAGEVAAQKTALSFVDSIWEIFGPLLQGVPSVTIPNTVVKDTEQFIEALAQHNVSRLVLVPSLLQAMLDTNPRLDEQLPALTEWICSGETFSGHLADRFRESMPHARMINLYGSSEVAGDVTWFDTQWIGSDSTFGTSNVPIGRPIANTQIYLLDKQMKPVPLGAMGEIYVGGENLARGYHNQPELTAERFVDNPFADDNNADDNNSDKLYYTADWGRYLPDGNIEFLGRRDSQVKIRGFRVELGEVEATLQLHQAVSKAVVEAKQLADDPSSLQLVAYIVPEATDVIDPSSLRADLLTTLPDYMVPGLFVQLEKMPLLPNGKVNRRGLPLPDAEMFTAATEYTAPTTPVEQKLVQIWADVLGFDAEEVGIHHNFFELGGHSLIATQLVSRIRQELDADISLRSVFQEPTIAGLSQQVADAEMTAQLPPITRADRTAPLALSFAQERLWFLMMYDPSSVAYNMPNALRLTGAFEPCDLASSVGLLLNRHESLRTVFPLVDGEPVQQIMLAPSHYNLPVMDISHLSGAALEQEAQHIIQNEAVRPFSLEEGPLFRILLVKLAKDDHILFTNMHHIITDGWSNDIFIHELITLYRSAIAGSAVSLPPLPFQYADYAQWQRTWLNEDMLEQQIDYWQKQLTGAPALLELTGDRPRPLVPTYQSQTLAYEIEPDLVHKLETIGRRHGATLFMTLLSAFGVLLHRYSRQDEVMIGSPIANRNHPDLEGLIGFFVNTLALRVDMTNSPTFADLLGRVHNMTMDAYANQDAPFAQIVERLPLDRDVSYNPIYQVMFALQNTPPMSTAGMDASDVVSHVHTAHGSQTTSLQVSPVEAERGSNHHDLMLLLSEDGNGLSGTLEFNLDIFNPETVTQMMDNFTLLLHSIAAQPDQPIDTLNMLGDVERALLVETWNEHSQPYPSDKHVAQLFEEEAALRPESVALIFGNEQMTYAQLNSQANRLAHYLLTQNAEPGARIGLCAERSFEMVIATLAILKAGCAYVPLDPSYPEERLHFMIQDAGMALILVQDKLANCLGTYSGARFSLNADWPKLVSYSDANPAEDWRPQARPQGLAYIMYTSGSTGQPKGAAIPHQAIVRLVKETNYMDLGPEQIFLQLAPTAFDAATLELWGPLLNGGKLVLLPPGQPTMTEIAHALVEHEITALFITTALFNMMVDEHLEQFVSVSQVLTGGETATVEKMNQYIAAMPPGHRLVHVYGPTENTTFTTGYPIFDSSLQFSSSVPIGRPISHTTTFVLDAEMQPVPVGVPGELYTGGDGVGLGYWNRPELTGERFVDNPFGPGKLYKTGDLVRYLPSGDIDFIGRIDAQVKIRGHRIELGEIEHCLALHPDIQQVVVLAREDVPGEKILVAYIVVVPEAHWDADEYRAAIVDALPAYMVPNIYIPIDAIPINPNGKVDRKALPAPDASTLTSSADYVPPANYLEEQLVEQWSQLFDMDSSLIGTNHSFFELGGHSLIAAKNVTQIDETFGVSVSLRRFFEEPTLAGLGEIIYTDLIDGVTPQEFAQILAEVEMESKNGN